MIHVVFLAKLDGGWWPILLYTTLYRVRVKVRIQYVKQWEMAPSPAGGCRSYWWGGFGKVFDRAMWQHAIKDEVSTGLRVGAAAAQGGEGNVLPSQATEAKP